MSLLLAVESTSGLYSVAAGSAGSRFAYRASRRDEPGFAGLGGLVQAALEELGAGAGDLDLLAVDIGPGNLSSVRAAVAYVDGLAFSLDLDIFGASSLELLATQYAQAGGLPVLCMRKASGGNAYLGLYQGTTPVRLTFGPLEQSVRSLCRGLTNVAVAGGPADVVAKLLPEAQVTDTGITHPDVDVLSELAVRSAELDGTLVKMAHPLNEGSLIFHEQSATDR
jgi:tRNA threonylcarbamoyl adenosine modification protein YeaZ